MATFATPPFGAYYQETSPSPSEVDPAFILASLKYKTKSPPSSPNRKRVRSPPPPCEGRHAHPKTFTPSSKPPLPKKQRTEAVTSPAPSQRKASDLCPFTVNATSHPLAKKILHRPLYHAPPPRGPTLALLGGNLRWYPHLPRQQTLPQCSLLLRATRPWKAGVDGASLRPSAKGGMPLHLHIPHPGRPSGILDASYRRRRLSLPTSTSHFGSMGLGPGSVGHHTVYVQKGAEILDPSFVNKSTQLNFFLFKLPSLVCDSSVPMN